MTTEKKSTEPKAKALPAAAALTTAPGRFGARSYAAGIIIEGVPLDVVEARAWLEADAAKVREARRAGAAVVRYRG
ncbi:hypothetical protein [Pantoea sp. 18069]|uniref:hypothetical protein n=1 Tax=Pantoea sp. 18069 TaxID=2681415 RepID=UPI0013575F1A|nr:hypothetical protein [Pantoea sp. 18069]